jgi:FdhE protein
MKPSAIDAWLAQHPYLQPLADLQAIIDCAADEVSIPAAPVPSWESYAPDFHQGVPLLHSEAVVIDWDPAEAALGELQDKLRWSPVPASIAADAGLQQWLEWSIGSRFLRDVIPAFGRWRDEEKWMRPSCPTCGAAPAMAQLVGSDPGRMRMLCCGCCRTRWRYRRTGCPFCRTEDDHRLTGFALAGEGRLRVDYCEQCNGYLKTYIGEGNESLWLSEWASLHLDVVARDRGLKRLATSLYEFDPVRHE